MEKEKKRKIISVLRTNELDRKQRKKYQVELKASIFPTRQSFLLHRVQSEIDRRRVGENIMKKTQLSNRKKSSRMRISKCEEEKFPIEIDIDSHGIGLRAECKVHKRVFEAFQPSPTEIAVRRAISANVLKTQHKAR